MHAPYVNAVASSWVVVHALDSAYGGLLELSISTLAGRGPRGCRSARGVFELQA